MAGANRKISAASARAHTRKSKQQNTSFKLPSGMFKKIFVFLLVGFLAWVYLAIQPPPPKICGSPDGPAITASRIKLKDGRYLAYKENGVPRDKANYKFVSVHGFDGCRHNALPLSPEFVEEFGVYQVSFDRAGYGESDPNPKRTLKTTALDIEELADQLGLGSKFYVIGVSMGGEVIWTCLKYIPHRLAGATLIVPVINYWWPGFPTNLSKEAYYEQLRQDQWMLRVAHYTPWLTYWWNTQKWFPSSSVAAHSADILSRHDKELIPKIAAIIKPEVRQHARQQGEFESIYRDIIISFGNWEFDPMDLENPFPNNEGSVHLWAGDEDRFVPISLQRYMVGKLPWIHYHELQGFGHRFAYADGMSDKIVKALILGEK